jgi:hypothetical protein
MYNTRMEECMICFSDTNEFMFYPCTHKVCKECFGKLNKCPLCNVTCIYVEPPEPAHVTDPSHVLSYLCCYSLILIGIILPLRSYL